MVLDSKKQLANMPNSLLEPPVKAVQ